MSFFRNILHDLVDKKLWPLALGLVVALIAVPVLLSSSGSEPASTTAAVPAGVPTGAAGAAPSGQDAGAQINAVVEEPLLHRRSGGVRDPFKQQYLAPSTTVAAPSSATSQATSPSSSSTSSTTTTPSGSGGGSTGTTNTGTTTTPTKTPSSSALDPLDVYRVTLRFGEPGGQKTIHDIPRLSPLPNADRPFFVFLGVLSGGKKAVFLVSADATPTGDATCRPSKTDCETVELGTGDTEFFDLETDNGVVQYQLDLLSVRHRTAAQAVAARRALAAAARAARKHRGSGKTRATKDSGGLTDELGTDAYRWDARRGVLVRRGANSSALHLSSGLEQLVRAASTSMSVLNDGAWHSDTP